MSHVLVLLFCYCRNHERSDKIKELLVSYCSMFLIINLRLLRYKKLPFIILNFVIIKNLYPTGGFILCCFSRVIKLYLKVRIIATCYLFKQSLQFSSFCSWQMMRLLYYFLFCKFCLELRMSWSYP
jgi:hypothetical protein